MPELKENKITEKAAPKADLVEIFSSYQGEGLFLGAKQIFIRFAGCNLDCSFCDTSKDTVIKNTTIEQVLGKVNDMERDFGSHHSISLTGGEPLLYASFLERLLPRLKVQNFKIYLETNGTLNEELKRIIAYVDIIAMDIKLPSSTDTPPLWKRHIEFLKIARKRNVFIKAVITDNTSERDIIEARDIVVGFDRDMLFVLQPASPVGQSDFAPKKRRLLDFLHISEEKLRNVRIIPQVHKFAGIK
jgi:organic radical activating enzyme